MNIEKESQKKKKKVNNKKTYILNQFVKALRRIENKNCKCKAKGEQKKMIQIQIKKWNINNAI